MTTFTPHSPGASLTSAPPSTPPTSSASSSSSSTSPSSPFGSPASSSPALSLLPQLEAAATLAYTSANNAERARNAELLAPFHSSKDCIPQCRLILEHSDNQYALLLASTSLLKLLTLYHPTFSSQQSLEMKHFLLNFLATKCSSLPPFVSTPLIQTLTRLVKLGWRVDAQFADILSDVSKFLAATPRHHRIGLLIMLELIGEMNENRTGESQVEHRRTARGFRDQTLLMVWTLSMQSIRQVAQQPGIGSDGELDELMGAALSLSTSCLTFDFIGSLLDESLDELAQMSLQIPAAWRPVMEDSATPQLFFDIIQVVRPQRQAQALEVLGGLATVRRSIFSTEDKRMAFLLVMARGVQHILASQSSILSDSSVFHQFCIALARLKTNYPLPELSKLPDYDSLISLIANFTLSAFKASSSPNSLHYLLLVWSRVVADVPYLKQEVSPFLNDFLPSISTVFIQSRLDAIVAAVRDDSVDDVFEEPALSDQLRSLPALLKYNYTRSKDWLKQAVDTTMRDYAASATSAVGGGDSNAVRVCEAQLAMLIYIWAAIIGWEKESVVQDKESVELYDAELCAWYFQSMPVVEFRLSASSSPSSTSVSPQLALSSLYFLQEFRKRFMQQVTKTQVESKEDAAQSSMMSEMASPTSDGGASSVSFTSPPSPSQLAAIAPLTHVVYPLVPAYLPFSFSPLLPLLSSHTYDVELGSYYTSTSRGTSFFHKLNSAYKALASSAQQQQQLKAHNITQTSIIANMLSTSLLYLNRFAASELVVSTSLELLEALSLGYASSQLLSSSEPMKQILSSHRFDAFPFLARAGATKARLHSALYLIIGRVLFRTANVEHFDAFMQPFEQAFAALQGMSNLRSEQSAQATIALCRKLQGLLEASVSYSTYMLMFDWLYPAYLPLILRLCETFADNLLVSSSILHFAAEFAFNRSQRIRFDANSANGIVLFKQCANLIQLYARRLLALKPEAQSEAYKQKLKGVSLTLTLLTRALSGGYANFGVMQLYEDMALTSTLTVTLQLLISLHLADLLAYPMLAEPYFAFLEVAYKQHMSILVDFEPKVFLALVSSLHEGLQSFSIACSTHCATAIDFLFSFAVTETRRKRHMANFARLQKHLQQAGGVVSELFQTLLTMYLFEPVSNAYSLSRPIFTLLVYEQAVWAGYMERLMAAQGSAEGAERVRAVMSDCLQGIQLTLDHDNKDRFFSHLTSMKNELNQFAVRLA